MRRKRTACVLLERVSQKKRNKGKGTPRLASEKK